MERKNKCSISLVAFVMLINSCMLLMTEWTNGQAETVSFGNISADRNVEYIDMGQETVMDWEGFYTFLRQFPKLKEVDLFATEIRAKRIDELTERFPDIAFGMSICIGEHIVRTDATAFSTLHTSHSPPHGDQELWLIRYCHQLKALDLGHNRLTDLSFLYDLPELRVLILAMNDLTDITPIGSLSHLEYLELFDNSIKDVSCLARLQFLMDLNLSQNDISDISPVAEIQSLKRLWMKYCQYQMSAEENKQTAEMIREALPGCIVDERNSGIEGDWRKHLHYDVIHRIFTSGVYEPFADSPEENIDKFGR